jgi:hypothetical protein
MTKAAWQHLCDVASLLEASARLDYDQPSRVQRQATDLALPAEDLRKQEPGREQAKDSEK